MYIKRSSKTVLLYIRSMKIVKSKYGFSSLEPGKPMNYGKYSWEKSNKIGTAARLWAKRNKVNLSFSTKKEGEELILIATEKV